MLKTLKQHLQATLLHDRTFYIYLDMRGGLTTEYAKLVLKLGLHDMILDIYKKKNLESEFALEGIPALIETWQQNIELLGRYASKPGKDKYVFQYKGSGPALRVFFMIGDNVLNRLSLCPTTRLELSNLMFNLVQKNGDPAVPALVYGDGDRMINLLTLKKNTLTTIV